MYRYEYVTKDVWKPVRDNLEKMIHEVQKQLREDKVFTFSYRFIGSSSRNMITCDNSKNKGFDFDVDIAPNDDEEEYSPKELKEILMEYFDNVSRKYGYNTHCENSTRVITLKFVDRKNNRIRHSVDFGVVNYCEDFVEYVHFNKNNNSYEWQIRSSGYDIEEKAKWICANGLKDELRERYLNKKNANYYDKKSRSLYFEAVNETYMANKQ